MAKFRIEILHRFDEFGKEYKLFYPQILVGDVWKYLTQKKVYTNEHTLDHTFEYLLTDKIVLDGFTRTECHYHNAVTKIRHYQTKYLSIKEQMITYEYLD